jgi:hypothetical protein
LVGPWKFLRFLLRWLSLSYEDDPFGRMGVVGAIPGLHAWGREVAGVVVWRVCDNPGGAFMCGKMVMAIHHAPPTYQGALLRTVEEGPRGGWGFFVQQKARAALG